MDRSLTRKFPESLVSPAAENPAQNSEKLNPCRMPEKRAAFHVEAGKVAQTINAKKYKEAKAMIDVRTPYESTSVEAGLAIVALKVDARL